MVVSQGPHDSRHKLGASKQDLKSTCWQAMLRLKGAWENPSFRLFQLPGLVAFFGLWQCRPSLGLHLDMATFPACSVCVCSVCVCSLFSEGWMVAVGPILRMLSP